MPRGVPKPEKTENPYPFPSRVPVLVTEQGIRPWQGEARGAKWSPVSGWWVDVRDDSSGLTIIVPASQVEEVSP